MRRHLALPVALNLAVAVVIGYAILSGWVPFLGGFRWAWMLASLWLIGSSAFLLAAPFLKTWPSGPAAALITRLFGASCGFSGLATAFVGLAPEPMPQHVLVLVVALTLVSFLSFQMALLAAIVAAVRQQRGKLTDGGA